MVLKCFWMECYQCGFPVASVDWTEEFLLPVPHTPVAHAVESSQLETARGAAPVLAMSSKESCMVIPYGTYTRECTRTTPQLCRFLLWPACFVTTKTSQASWPSWCQGPNWAPARTESHRLKACFGPYVFISCLKFFFPFPPYGEGNAFFYLSQFLKKSPKSVWRYLVKNKKKNEQICGDKEQLLLL